MKNEKIFITVAGLHHYFGVKMFSDNKGLEVTLEKEPDNEYDNEAIMVKLEGLGTIGYVANSISTTLGETHSAGRIYDKFDKIAKAKVLYSIEEKDSIICELIK